MTNFLLNEIAKDFPQAYLLDDKIEPKIAFTIQATRDDYLELVTEAETKVLETRVRFMDEFQSYVYAPTINVVGFGDEVIISFKISIR